MSLLNTYSQTFIDNRSLYQRYKIIGLTASAYRLYAEDNVSGLLGTYSMGVVWLMQYGLATLTDLGTAPIFSDNNFSIPPFSIMRVSHGLMLVESRLLVYRD